MQGGYKKDVNYWQTRYERERNIPVPRYELAKSHYHCGKKMRLKRGMYGEFYSCANYPKCKGSLQTKKQKAIFQKQQFEAFDKKDAEKKLGWI